MSGEMKSCIRFYTLTDYEKEEQWLREMANKGWMLESVKLIHYTFRKTEPKDIVFQLDFQEKKVEPDDAYMQMIADYGWTYLTSVNNYRYLYKEAAGSEAENEIYTDNQSKYEMLKRIIRFRVLPILCIFLCCVIPGFSRAVQGEFDSIILQIFWEIIMVLYVVIILKVGFGYSRLLKKYNPKE